jgi:hypothetical protein
VGCDGASVMLGEVKGVAGILKCSGGVGCWIDSLSRHQNRSPIQ